jgi:hypothetical protein
MKNTLQETTGSKNTHEEKGVVLVNNPESQKMINEINSIHDVLMSNQDITEKALQKIIKSIQGNFENSQFDLYGEIVDMQFVKKHGKEIEKNKDIWQEILDGNFDNHEKLTFLISSVAYAFTQFQKECLWLNGLQSINKDSALVLSQLEVDELFLNGLESIDKEVAYAFAQFKGSNLILNGIQIIDKDIFLALSQFKGKLWLSNEIQQQIDLYVKENNKKK